MTRLEREILDRRKALSQKNLLYAAEVGSRDALKRNRSQRVKTLRTKPAILGKIEFVPKKESNAIPTS